MNRSREKRRTGRRPGHGGRIAAIGDAKRSLAAGSSSRTGTALTDRLVWQSDPAVTPLTIDLAEYFRDVTDEG